MLKEKIFSVLTIAGLALFMFVGLYLQKDIKAANNETAFTSASKPLNDAIIAEYPDYFNISDGTVIEIDGEEWISADGAKDYDGEILVINKGITGTLEGIETFEKMTYLNLRENQLSGEIPKGIANLTKLKELYLVSNQLSGEIPKEIGNLTELNSLILRFNKLSGDIPVEISNIENIELIDFSHNQLTGVISDEFENLEKIREFSFDYNHITGVPVKLYNIISRDGKTSIDHQTLEQGLEDGFIKQDYQFDALPVFMQVPKYSVDGFNNLSEIVYKLIKPNGETVDIDNAAIQDDKVVIDKSYLQDVGEYKFKAMITKGALEGSVYEFSFNLKEDKRVEFIKASANGESKKQKSDKITIKIKGKSEDLGLDFLKIDDIILKDQTRAVTSINKESLDYLGDGIYELSISGEWTNDSALKISLEADTYEFTPDSRDIALYNVEDEDNNGSTNGEDGNGSTDIDDGKGNNVNTNETSKMPETGTNEMNIAVIFGAIGTLLTSGYFIIRKKYNI